MPWRLPTASVLGPHPGTPSNPQALTASTTVSGTTPSNPLSWDQAGLLQALNNAGINTSQPRGSSDWFLDIGASSHFSSNSGILHNLFPISNSSRIIFGNGHIFPLLTLNTPLYPPLLPLFTFVMFCSILISSRICCLFVLSLEIIMQLSNLTMMVFLLRISPPGR